jgi:hypothetical protein
MLRKISKLHIKRETVAHLGAKSLQVMCELDAARVVVESARRAVAGGVEGMASVIGLRSSLERHDRLVGPGDKPSEWTK